MVTVERTVPGPTMTTTATTTIEAKPLPARTVTLKPPQATVTVTARPVPVIRTTERPAPPEAGTGGAYYANCSEARAAGVTPLHTGDPGYASHLDRDHDGVACE